MSVKRAGTVVQWIQWAVKTKIERLCWTQGAIKEGGCEFLWKIYYKGLGVVRWRYD